MPSSNPSTPHGVRISVSLYGSVTSQTVHWPVRGVQAIGAGVDDAVPTSDGGPLLHVRWQPGGVRLLGAQPGLADATLRPGERWHWSNEEGVEVALDLVPRIRAQRMGADSFGDAALLTLMLMLLVGVGQARWMVAAVFPGGLVAPPTTWEPSPELIARLLEKDLEGQTETWQPAPTISLAQPTDTYTLPVGSDSAAAHPGGSAQTGPMIARTEPAEAAGSDSLTDASDARAPEAPRPTSRMPPTGEGIAATSPAPAQPATAGCHGADHRDTADPIARFIGWGFQDWMEVAAADAPEALTTELSQLRQRLQINPDDAWALATLGDAAYRLGRLALSRASYDRYVALYPDHALGYNNLALTYKRLGDYTEEEDLYRSALKLEPDNPHVLNNFAVCLARQGHFAQALEVMSRLEQLDVSTPYTELHQAKIYTAMGKREHAYRHLRSALAGAHGLDVLHHIEFRQDLRLDPLFDTLRQERRFRRLIRRYYGEDAAAILGGDRG